MKMSWQLGASHERSVVIAYLSVSVVPLSIRVLILVLEPIFGGRESSVLYTPLVMLGMLIEPLSWIGAIGGLLILTLLPLAVRTPVTLLMWVQGLGIIFAISWVGFVPYCGYVTSFSSWATLQYFTLGLTSFLMLFATKSRPALKPPCQADKT